jgi:hypothetical protein
MTARPRRGRPPTAEALARLLDGTATQRDYSVVAEPSARVLRLCQLWIFVQVERAAYGEKIKDTKLLKSIAERSEQYLKWSADRKAGAERGHKTEKQCKLELPPGGIPPFMANFSTLRRRYAEAKQLIENDTQLREFCERAVKHRIEHPPTLTPDPKHVVRSMLLAALAQFGPVTPDRLSADNEKLAEAVGHLIAGQEQMRGEVLSALTKIAQTALSLAEKRRDLST